MFAVRVMTWFGVFDLYVSANKSGYVYSVTARAAWEVLRRAQIVISKQVMRDTQGAITS